MKISFQWDDKKSKSNQRKHGITFEDAATVFGDSLSLTVPDPAHTRPSEARFITIGQSRQGKIIVVIHCDREEEIRIISAREAASGERNDYEEKR